MNDQTAVLTSLSGAAPALQGVTARGTVTGLHFELTVEQRYRNTNKKNIEAVYTFPLPWGAILLSLEFEIGGKRLQGRVVEMKVAQEEYEDALDKGNAAVLLERTAEGLYTVNVGNLLAGESAVVRYRYAQLLSFVKGQVRLSVPTVIAPRYGNPMSQGGLQAQQVPETDLMAEYPFAIEVDIEGPLAQGTVASPSHSIALRRTERGIRASLSGTGFLDRDFILSIDEIQSAATATVARDGDGYVVHAAFSPSIAAIGTPPARALKILVDCSGSMAGDSIAAAQRALHEILSRLESRDRFSLARFGSSFHPTHKKLVPATKATIRSASEAVSNLSADLGGTEMAAALVAVLKQDAEETADILLITDGEVWNLDELIKEARSYRQHVFAVGIGSAPAESLLRRLAQETGGSSEFVAPLEDVAGAITRMFLRTSQLPASSVQFRIDGDAIWATPTPSAIYDGETIHVFAGLAHAPSGEAKLEFEMTDGTKGTQVVRMTMEAEDTSLARIAAWHRLPTIAEDERAGFATRYRLVTDLTSLVLVHPREAGEEAQELPQTVVVPQMMAAGWGGSGAVAIRRCVAVAAFSRDGTSDSVGAVFRMRAKPESKRSMRSVAADAMDYLGINQWLSRGQDEASPQDLIDLLADKALTGELFGKPRLPRTIKDLEVLSLPARVIHALRKVVDRGFPERIVVSAFLDVVTHSTKPSSAINQAMRASLDLLRDSDQGASVRAVVQMLFAGTTPSTWQVKA